MPFPFEFLTQSDPQRAALREQLQSALRGAVALRGRAQGNPITRADRLAVRQYQSARLRETHADLLASRDFQAAARFFFDEVYCEVVPSWRDAQLVNALPSLSKLLPAPALEPIAAAMSLDWLTEELDENLCHALRRSATPGEALRITPATYAAAYRQGPRARRERQIEYVGSICSSLSRASRLPLVPQALGAMRLPARALGLSELQGFLERGLSAFRSLRDPEEFGRLLSSREKALSDALFDSAPAQPSEGIE